MWVSRSRRTTNGASKCCGPGGCKVGGHLHLRISGVDACLCQLESKDSCPAAARLDTPVGPELGCGEQARDRSGIAGIRRSRPMNLPRRPGNPPRSSLVICGQAFRRTDEIGWPGADAPGNRTFGRARIPVVGRLRRRATTQALGLHGRLRRAVATSETARRAVRAQRVGDRTTDLRPRDGRLTAIDACHMPSLGWILSHFVRGSARPPGGWADRRRDGAFRARSDAVRSKVGPT